MPRPKSKLELLESSTLGYLKLKSLIDTYSDAELHTEFKPGTLNRNIKDVVIHLHEWHNLMLGWYQVGMKGEKPIMPAEDYTWRTLPDFNKMLWIMNKDIKLESALKLLDNSHKKVMELIENHSDKELFTKKYYPWTGSTSLGSYLVSNAVSHYKWAHKLIRTGLKKQK